MASTALLSAIVVVALSAPTFAHHPFADEFDQSQPVTLQGTMTKLEWQNPHVYFYMDVKDDAGGVSNWKVELGRPTSLTNDGWTKTSITAGDMVTVKGWRARKQANVANAESFTLADGRTIAAASSLYEVPGQLARTETDATTRGTSGALPDTASALPWLAILGGLSLFGAAGLRRMRP